MDRVFHLKELETVAEACWSAAQGARVIAFHGSLGAGKTTLIAALCRQQGVLSSVSSPTFALANEYLLPNGRGVIYHLDFYRLQHASEAFEAGLEDLLHSESLCFVEWPERVPAILPAGTVHVWLEGVSDAERRIIVRIPTENG